MKASCKSLYGRLRRIAFEQLAAVIGRGKKFALGTLCPRSSEFLTILPLIVGASILSRAPLQAQVSVLTSQNDNNRSGQNIQEPFLNSINVKSATFAKLGSYSVDGFVVGQPLYMPNVSIPGTGQRNVVFVADQHDSVYAFDADNPSSGTPLWQISLINPAAGVTTVPISEQGCAAVNGYTEVGIQGTPVIDATTNTLYLDAKTKEVVNGVTSYIHRLHALDISTGAEKFGGPVQITGSVQGSRGTVTFDSLKSCQRPGLLLEDGIVYIAYGSNGCDTTHGWVFAYNATTLVQRSVFNTSPNVPKGATVWQGGAGLAADSDGNVYFITANGTFDADTGGSDFGDSFMKLSPAAGAMTWVDYFTPYDQAQMATNDLDLGSGGMMLLPDQPAPSPTRLAIGAGKTGTIYLVNRDNMGHFQPNNNNQIVQWLQNALAEVEGTPAYWNGAVYFAPVHSSVVAYSLTNGLLSSQPVAQSLAITPIGAPAISANSGTNGIVWLIRQSGASSAMLSAFDAAKLTELYNTVQVSARDSLGATAHFAIPTIANGKAYVGTQTQLAIYGLLPVLSPVSGANQTGAAGTTLTVPLTVQAINPYTGAAIAGAPITFSDGGKNGTFGTPTATTDSAGQASTTYTMPKTFTKPTITITGTSPGYAPAAFVETVTAGSPASVTVVSGGSQTGTVGTTLSAPIVVKVTDSYGNVVPGISVSFSSGIFGGTFSNNPVTTDSFGRASVSYTLPTKAGYITITASTGSLSKNITEHAVAGSPSAVNIVSGNNQSAKPNTLLPKPLNVSVKDQYGNAVAGVTVSFTDNGAGGTLSSAAITNALGQASVQYTTPPQSGPVTINGTVTGLTPVVFNETVL